MLMLMADANACRTPEPAVSDAKQLKMCPLLMEPVRRCRASIDVVQPRRAVGQHAPFGQRESRTPASKWPEEEKKKQTTYLTNVVN